MNTASFTAISDWINAHPVVWVLILAWSLTWKGVALWKAAELQQKYWFVALLVVNTLGLLEIFYLFAIAQKYKVEVIEN